MPNSSSVSEFLLVAFADTRDLQLLHFALFLGIYLAALLGNGLILTTVACNHRLQTPMYFFLLKLALLDLGSISTTVPKAMANSLWDTRAISYQGCVAQVFIFAFLVGVEFSILTVMAYDRYVAICKPLHYGSLLGSRASPAQGLLGRPRAAFVPAAAVPCKGLGLWWLCPEPCSSLQWALTWVQPSLGCWAGLGWTGLGWAGQCPAKGNSSIRERWQHAGEGTQQGLVLQSQGCMEGAQSCRDRGEEAALGPCWPGQSRRGAQGISNMS
ncbi:Olfactory receptor 14C36-like protein [Aix galericulata]|nr:Olfactory receptor 14C36-like protein [Aix galericulata]